MDERKVLEDNLRLVLVWDDDELVDLLADDEWCDYEEAPSHKLTSQPVVGKARRIDTSLKPDAEIEFGQYLDHVYENRGDR